MEIRGLTSDSRQAKAGTVFVAVRGEKADGHSFLLPALASGAFVVGEKDHTHPRYLQVADSRLALGLLASAFYAHPSHAMKMIGITGTSGKTTTTYLVESILRAAGLKTGVIGTVNVRIGDEELPSTHTTPGPIELQGILAQMKTQGCQAVVMEVSSHALKQHRAAGVAFDGMVFTNLSPEHLDYHPDMEEYFAAKKILFAEQAARSRAAGKNPFAAIHSSDSHGERLLRELAEAKTFPKKQVAGFAVSSATVIDQHGIQGSFSGVEIHSPLLARFNAENIAAAVAVTLGIGVAPALVKQGIEALNGVPGRLERVPDPLGGRTILVDYAHKPDALEKVLETLRAIRGSGKLITVFGCGGDRDRTKRPRMGEIACRLSDHVIVTSDNPRTEDPGAIIAEIVAPLATLKNFEIEADREKAIGLALKRATSGDLVLIAGKGHEDYQILGVEKIRFDDREVAAQAALKG